MFSRGIVEQPVDGLDIVVQLLKDLDFHNVAVKQVLLHTHATNGEAGLLHTSHAS